MGEQTFSIPDETLEQHIITLFDKLECMRREASSEAVGLCGRAPARLEVRSMALWKAVAAETVASFLYVYMVCGAASGAGVGASTSAVVLATAVASGCAIAALTLCFGHISGAHVSAAVTAALLVRRRVSPLRAALYVLGQCGGGVAGAAAVYGLSARAGAGGGGDAWQRLGAELALSALLVATHMAGAARRWAGTAPLLQGAVYCGATFVSMPWLSPARALGTSFVLSRWEAHWVCWAGAVGGGAACGLLHEWGARRAGGSRPASPDELDKEQFPHHHHRPTYCTAPRPDAAEPLYAGTKSLYCRSPPPARHTLHRSQSVYSKSSGTGGGGPLVAAQSLLLRAPPLTSGPHTHVPHAPHAPHVPHAHAPHVTHGHTTLTHNQNAHNAQREPAYGVSAVGVGVRPGPAGAPSQEPRRESVYGRRGPLSSDDSAYGTYSRSYRAPAHDY